MACSFARRLRDVFISSKRSRADSTFPFHRYMDSRAPGSMFTHAASLASTTARAIRRASAAVEHVTRTTNLSVKISSKPVTLSRFPHIPSGCPSHVTLQYFAGDTIILFANACGLYFWPAK